MSSNARELDYDVVVVGSGFGGDAHPEHGFVGLRICTGRWPTAGG